MASFSVASGIVNPGNIPGMNIPLPAKFRWGWNIPFHSWNKAYLSRSGVELQHWPRDCVVSTASFMARAYTKRPPSSHNVPFFLDFSSLTQIFSSSEQSCSSHLYLSMSSHVLLASWFHHATSWMDYIYVLSIVGRHIKCCMMRQ